MEQSDDDQGSGEDDQQADEHKNSMAFFDGLDGAANGGTTR
jgi:hypothetical protein